MAGKGQSQVCGPYNLLTVTSGKSLQLCSPQFSHLYIIRIIFPLPGCL